MTISRVSGSGRPAETSRVVLLRRGFLLLILLTVFWGANWPLFPSKSLILKGAPATF